MLEKKSFTKEKKNSNQQTLYETSPTTTHGLLLSSVCVLVVVRVVEKPDSGGRFLCHILKPATTTFSHNRLLPNDGIKPSFVFWPL